MACSRCSGAADQVYVDPALIEYAVRLATATRTPEAHGLRRPQALHHLRRQPARLDQPDPHGPGAGLRPRPRLRAARGRASTWRSTSSATASCCRSRPSPTTSPATSILRHDPRPDARPGRPAARPMTASTSAPERILQRLDWQVVRRLDGLLQGDYRSLFRGNGLDFADLREYQYGDDVRYIDWNVTARMDTPYVREYIEDREITAWFLLDLSPSVDFGTVESERQKRTVLIDFVTTLARLLTRHGNRVGAVFYGGRVERIDPGPRRPDPGPAAHQRPARRSRACAAAPFTDLTPLLEAGQRCDQGPLARVRHLGLHQRPGLGALARAADPAPRGPRRPAVRPARDRAARRRPDDPRGRRDRRAALRRHPRRGVPAPLRGGGRAARGGRSRPRSGGPASTPSSLSTDEDLRRGDRPDGGAPAGGGGAERCRSSGRRCSCSLLADPARRRWSTGGAERRRAARAAAFGSGLARGCAAQPAAAGRSVPARRRGPWRPPAPGGPARSPADRPRPRARAAAERRSASRGRGHGHPRVRRLGQHGRHRPRADAGWRRPRRPPARSSSASRRRVRIGVVAFSDSGLLVQVPTDDRGRVVAAIDRLEPERGTSLGRGIQTSLTAIDRGGRDPPGVDYYTNRSPGADARADAGPGRRRTARGHRPAERRREHRNAGSARARPGRRRPRRPDLHGRHRQRRPGRRSRSTASRIHTPARRGRAPGRSPSTTDGTYYAGRPTRPT